MTVRRGLSALAALVAFTFSSAASACSIEVSADAIEAFRATSRAVLKDQSKGTLLDLLSARGADAEASPAEWIRKQLCPFLTSLDPQAEAGLKDIPSQTRWIETANSLYHVQLLRASPGYFKSLADALRRFRNLPQFRTGANPTKLDASQLLIEASERTAYANLATTGSTPLDDIYGKFSLKPAPTSQERK